MAVSKSALFGVAGLLAMLWFAAVSCAMEDQQDMEAFLQRTRRAYFSKKDDRDSVVVPDCLTGCEVGYQSCGDACANSPGCPLLGCLFKKQRCNKTCYARISRREAPVNEMLMNFD